MKKFNDYEISSGNVFADLELPDARELLAKAELVWQINSIIKQKGLTQISAAKVLGVDKEQIAALNKGSLSHFSLETLFQFLNTFDQDIVIKVASKKKTKIAADLAVSFSQNIKIPQTKQPTNASVTVQARKKQGTLPKKQLKK